MIIIPPPSVTPNIYWIHADGMLSFEAVEKYFNDKQTEFLEELSKRDFIVNPTAKFEAMHTTWIAIPILMNPYSYDNWIHNVIFLDKKFANYYAYQLFRMNSELQYAFSAKNYALDIIGVHRYYYPIHGGHLWITAADDIRGRKQIFSFDVLRNNFFLELRNFDNLYFQNVVNILFGIFKSNLTTGLIGENYKIKIDDNKLKEIFITAQDNSNPELDFVAALYDILYGNYPEPRLTIIHNLTPHCPFDHDVNGLKIKNGNMNPLDYHSQHIWSGKVLINVIDMILEVDPDAVIVIQADHGMHENTEEDFKTAFGEKADPKELWNSTMSAIRVPEKFKTGEEHYAMETPLNITRYLVNTFVGKNYDYISADVAY